MRISRADVPDVFDESLHVEIGRGIMVHQGHDVTLISTGYMLSRCLQAADALANDGISARVLSLATIKPLDIDLVCQAAAETGAIVTAEDHTIVGGLGSAVAEAIATHCPVPIDFVGLADTFAETGPDTETLMDAWGLSVGDIIRAAKRVIKRHAI
jgi:transketolase